MGPELGEKITVCRIKRRRRNKLDDELIPTTSSFITEEVDDCARYPIETVPCPDCRSLSLRLGFADGELCPECKAGTLESIFVEY